MNHKIKKRLQIALRRYYLNSSPSKEIAKLLSINQEDFKKYIDNQRISGMIKENFGKKWGLDHIVPSEVFDLKKDEELTLCYHYLNFMPMFNEDNRMKGGSIHFSIQKLEQKIKLEKDQDNLKILYKLLDKAISELSIRYNKYLM